MTLVEVHVRPSGILIDRLQLGPESLSTLRMKGQVLHRARARVDKYQVACEI